VSNVTIKIIIRLDKAVLNFFNKKIFLLLYKKSKLKNIGIGIRIRVLSVAFLKKLYINTLQKAKRGPSDWAS
jgi:hypothetical protein